jgi:hypothetical protein
MSLDITLTGKLRLLLTDEHGRVKADVETENAFLDQGKAVVANIMQLTPTQPRPSHMAIGVQSSIPAGPSNITLQQEVARVALLSQAVTGGQPICNYNASFGPGVGTGAIQEAGLYGNAVANGQPAFTRATFGVINKAAADTLAIAWTVTVG